MFPLLLTLQARGRFVFRHKLILAVQAAEVPQHHFCGLVITVMKQHSLNLSQQLLKDCKVDRLAAFFDLLADFLEDVEAVVYIDEAHLPLAFDLLVVFLNVGPLLQRPLD